MNEELYHQQFPKWFSFLVVLVVFQLVGRCGECYHRYLCLYERIHIRQSYLLVYLHLPMNEELYR